METIKLTIDNRTAEVAPGTNLVEAAASIGIKIPTLCYLNLHELGCKNDPGVCRICVVEVEGRKNLAPACKTVCTEGMVVRTHTPRVINARQTILELILSDHPNECLTCSKNGYCSLQTMAKDLGIREAKYKGETTKPMMDLSPSVVRNMEKCILCRRCETVCNQVQTVGALSVVGRGFTSVLCTAFNDPILTTNCVNCGQCVAVCPTSALSENSNIREVMQALADPGKTVVVQTAPAVRVALGQDFGLEGRSVTGKMTTALRRLGFDYVFDTDFAADLTIMEEGTELLQRLNKYLAGDRTVKIPLMTSCCPGWVSFMEKHFPELGENLSTAKSPQQMFGAIAKNYLAPKLGIDRRNFIVVSVMPCVAKKSEAARPEFGKDGDPDVNISITTRELAHMIRFANMNFDELEESDFDRPLGESTGAGVIFGTTGGVIEAAVRTAYEIQTKKTLPKLDFTELRGLAGIRSATIDFDGVPVKIGIAHGLGNARRLVEEIRAGRSPYHAIEIMACPGGCINGGGQPYHRGNEELLKRRAEALYAEDAARESRHSGTLRRVPRRTLRTAFARTAPHPLLRPQTGRGTQEIRRYGKNMPLPTENRRDKERLPKVRQRPGRTDQHPARRAGHAGLSAQRGTGAHRPGVGHLGRTGLRRGVVLFVLHDEAQRQIPDFGLHGHGLLCPGRREGARRIQTPARHRSRRHDPRRALLARFAAVRGCLRTRSGRDDRPPGLWTAQGDRCQRYPRRNPGPRKRDLTTRYYVK